MLRAVAAVLACLCAARSSQAEPYNLRLYTQTPKEINTILSSIEERLRLLDTISVAQEKQARRLDFIQEKLDHVENTLTLKLERAQLAAEKLEHRLHMLQSNVQTSIKESSEKLEKSQMRIADLTLNLTHHIVTHKHLLEKVNGAYSDTWHRSLVLEALMRDGLSLINVTRRELADGLRTLVRRQRDARLNSNDLDTLFTKRISENTNKIDQKMQELVDAQKSFIDSCQQVQQDDPHPVADILEKLIEALLKMKISTAHELHRIQDNINRHDSKIAKVLNTQSDVTCRRLETAFRNTSHTILKENELRQLTEKFISLTDRADDTLQRLEAQLRLDNDDPLPLPEDIKLMQKFKKDNRESEDYHDSDDDDTEYFHEDKGGGDIIGEDRMILGGVRKKARTTTVRPQHRRHLHKHPYDRGPTIKDPSN